MIINMSLEWDCYILNTQIHKYKINFRNDHYMQSIVNQFSKIAFQ
jgi:hypothetical protein